MRDIGFSIKLVYPIVKTLVRQGVRVDRFFAATGFDERLLQDADARLSEIDYERLQIAAGELTGDESFGVRQGLEMDITDFGILGYVMTHSATLRESFEAYRRYNVVLCNGIDMTAVDAGDDVEIRIDIPKASDNPCRHCAEGAASSIIQIMSRLSGKTIPVRSVHFIYPEPKVLGAHASAWGVIPRFGSLANVIRIDKEAMDYPIVYADARLLQAFEDILENARSRLLQGRALSDELLDWMISVMPSSLPTLADASRHFRMSARSLQTKLKQEETSFYEILTLVRMELAEKYLSNRQHSVGEVAYLLHYAEPSAFQNAFKKRKGITPGQYRLRPVGS